MDKLSKVIDYYEENTDFTNIVDSCYPKEYYEIFKLLPLDMSCIEYVDTFLERQGEYIDDLDYNNLNLRDIIALISYMEVQDRIWDTTSYFIRNGIALRILRRLKSLCMNKTGEDMTGVQTKKKLKK